VQNAPLPLALDILYLVIMVTPRYHVHIDAAHMPVLFSQKAMDLHGLKADNFDHSFTINGVKHAGSHFTKLFYEEDTTSDNIRMTCEDLVAQANETDFVGLIQCEFIIEELEWNGNEVFEGSTPIPFKIQKRALNVNKGEKFKKHELHLKIKHNPPALAIINALIDTDMNMIEGPNDVTFTCNGNPQELLLIKKQLKTFLNAHSKHFTGRMTYEATAFWSMHGMDESALPMIVDSVQVL
jgi:hypothetical protein